MAGLNYPDIMVDIETTGLQPHASAIIQIGAVPFNYDTGEIDTDNMFCMSLSMPKNRYWNSGTENFWLRDNAEVYMQIMEKAQAPDFVIRQFHQWCIDRLTSTEEGDLRWWSKGWMDHATVESYFLDANLDMPFNFRQAKDMRSFIAGLNGSAVYVDPEVEKVGTYHNALHDALTQLKQLFKAKEETCQSVVTSD